MNENNKKGGGLGIIALALIALFILKHLGKIVGTIFWIAVVVVGGGFIVLLIALIAGSFKQGKEDADAKNGAQSAGEALTEEQSAAIKKTKSTITKIKIDSSKIKDADIRNSFMSVCSQMEKVLNAIKEQPQDYQSGHRVCTYYADATLEIESKYLTLQNSGLDYTEQSEKLKNGLSEIHTALDNLYNGLFENDKLDFTVEMKALSVALQRDGLID